MGQRPDADLIIIGGGCAGLSLASRLAQARSALSVRILEPRDHYTDDRSWCFWRPKSHDLSHLVSASWDTWGFSRLGEVPHIHSQKQILYQYVRSTDFYQQARDAISDTPKIGLELGVSADQIHNATDGLVVETSKGSLKSRYVVDTRPPRARISSRATLFQCFAGYELAMPGGHGLDVSTAELMTDMRCDELGFVFSYILPLTRDKLLVETTRFAFSPVAREQLTLDLTGLLERRDWTGGDILRREFGVLPMGLPPEKAPGMAGVFRAGIGTGGFRAASGYGFLRIQDWSDRCAHRILSGQSPVSHPAEPAIRQQVNQAFLRALKVEPDGSPDFFMNLVQTLQADELIRFMSDRANVKDMIKIISQVSDLPLIKASFSNEKSARKSPRSTSG